MARKRGNNEGTIRKRSDGRWEARILMEDGTRRSFYGKTRQERFVDESGKVRKRMRRLPHSEWSIVIRDHHQGFVDACVTKVLKKRGEQAKVGEVIGYMEAGVVKAAAPVATEKGTLDSHDPEPVYRVQVLPPCHEACPVR
jgi:hypothetical protein